MSAFLIEKRTVVSGGKLKDPAVLKNIKVVDGIEFFKAIKGDPVLVRILTGACHRNQRVLKNHDLFCRLSQLRDATVEKLTNPLAKSDLGIDDDSHPLKRRKACPLLINIPEVVEVALPPVDGHDGLSIRVLAGFGKDPLWLELSPSVLQYLTHVFDQRVHDDDEPTVDGSENQGDKQLETHITYDQARKAYRVRYKGTSKWFPISRGGDTLANARSYLHTLQTNDGQD